jgi:type VI protein secretion system component VasK
MNRIPIGFAEVAPEDLPGANGWPADARIDVFVVVGALALIVVLVLIWAVAIRKPRRRHHHHRHHHHHAPEQRGVNPDADLTEQDGQDEKSAETRRRRRRHEHRPRNPTLAETGGLPPIRSEKPPGG